MIERILSLFGWGDHEEDADTDERPEIAQHDLRHVTEMMCTVYPDGIPPANEALIFGDHSMKHVAGRWITGNSVGVEEVLVLDNILEESVEEEFAQAIDGKYIPRRKVEQFRRIFYDHLSEDEIQRLLGDVYWDAKEGFSLEQLFDLQSIDYDYYTIERTKPSSASIMEEEREIPMELPEIESETVEMMKFGARVDLSSTNVTYQMDDLVRTEAKHLVERMGISDADYPTEDSFVDAVCRVEEAMYHPDTVVSGEYVRGGLPFSTYEMNITEDTTGAFTGVLVADSGNVGMKFVQQPPTVEKMERNMEHPHRYVLQWRGNYAVYHDDAFAVA